ncbi:phosphatidylinositol-binding clathrin assembly protein-like [Notothenia coriiceps]|uniref:Phosphatidylinositol-binding clathrin assembly protein-like n=1 Tax=Notothenia coriiceps TaxID=8208 RepID=A0A6I9NYI9_9TELE|nr:PREDICTED: phosphatidylinositol-binding clathrin assembly protein-like [Notothenia coriiceps]
MLPWLFLEPDALCYLPVRPTNSGCCCVCVCLKIFSVNRREKVEKVKVLTECVSSLQAPSSLLEALEQHLASLEGKKTKELNADTRASTLSSAVSSLSSTGMSFSRMDEKEKQQALEEEQARLQALKVTHSPL